MNFAKTTRKLITVLAFLVSGSFAFAADEWTKYVAKDYGFEMLVPKGAMLVEREQPSGWGELSCKHDGVEFYALAKLGEAEEKKDIRSFAEKTYGVPSQKWTKFDEGKNDNGWIWYEIYVAEKGESLIFGGFGTGPKGNYLVFLKTTKEDYEQHKADYKTWINSVKLSK